MSTDTPHTGMAPRRRLTLGPLHARHRLCLSVPAAVYDALAAMAPAERTRVHPVLKLALGQALQVWQAPDGDPGLPSTDATWEAIEAALRQVKQELAVLDAERNGVLDRYMELLRRMEQAGQRQGL